MKISERSISALAKIVTGDSQISPYKSGPTLVRLFNEFGANDVYGQGFPSRWYYAEEKIRAINDTHTLSDLIRTIFDPREWLAFEKSPDEAVAYLNDYLKFDGFEVVEDGDFFLVRNLTSGAVAFDYPSQKSREVNQIFIDQQIKKCDRKLSENDFDGAITNARSMLEAVLSEVDLELSPQSPPPYDGDLGKLYKRVQNLLNLEPRRTDIEGPLKQVLGGLASIVSGLAGLRNKMGDAHVRSYQPAKRHAVLVVNAAKTLAAFVVETKEHNVAKGTR
ncbi:MAG: abortive infection family protein [Phycisphaerae bacterium]